MRLHHVAPGSKTIFQSVPVGKAALIISLASPEFIVGVHATESFVFKDDIGIKPAFEIHLNNGRLLYGMCIKIACRNVRIKLPVQFRFNIRALTEHALVVSAIV